MKRILLLCLIVGTLSVPVQAEKFLNRVVAVVNGDVITQSELEQAMAMMAPQLGMMRGLAATSAYATVRKAALDHLIDDRLVKVAMEKSPVTVDESQIDMAMGNFLREKKITDAQLQTVLAQHGLTIGDFRERMRMQIAQQQFIQEAVGRKIVPTESEVRNFYQRNRSKLTTARGSKINGTIPLDAIKPQMEQMLFGEKMNQALEQYVAELRARAYIEVKE